ncbi:hypothetical protein Pcinc_043354 [Petrolisthes cinctipes]|uniref:Uncharacterized protein n=1 Tax=Petrolisthes cinctipes TaxID=88211 RepID=A0AAE1BJA6_PETCI|nr:hypothetical protein Pcinc_043354 [Petrolisthes cinctipes]
MKCFGIPTYCTTTPRLFPTLTIHASRPLPLITSPVHHLPRQYTSSPATCLTQLPYASPYIKSLTSTNSLPSSPLHAYCILPHPYLTPPPPIYLTPTSPLHHLPDLSITLHHLPSSPHDPSRDTSALRHSSGEARRPGKLSE